MKNILLIIVLFVCGIAAVAQDKAALESATEKMYTASYNLDFEAILDQTYPKLFELAPRPAVTEQIKSALDNEMMAIVFNSPKVDFTYADIKTIGEQKFCVVRYLNSMTMKMKPDIDVDMGSQIANNLKKSGKFQKISHDEKTNHILAEGNAILIAISDKSTNWQWKFINYSDEIFTTLFDENIKNTLGL
jgi:hypothetical protein